MEALRRCHVPPEDWHDREMLLTPDAEHYLIHVLRARDGDEVNLFDGHGREALACLRCGGAAGRARLEVRSISIAPAPLCHLTLLQALPKSGKMDWIVEKATELGVSSIVPLLTARAIGGSDKHLSRWQRLAIGAARQCGTPWVPEIGPICRIADLPGVLAAVDLFLVGCLDARAKPLHTVIEAAKGRDCRRMALLIGPEGDLAPHELDELLRLGAEPVSLGGLVLRVETAALYALSVLNYEFLRTRPAAGRHLAR
jgi:16S rRNA (uracil1498-N3)-methyltransferase